MAYIDETYYTDTYKGTPVNSTDFPRLAERASDLIDGMTYYTIHNYEFTQLATFIQDNVKKAVAAQVEYMAESESNVNHGQSKVTSMNIGNFSYNEANGANESLSREQTRTSPAVVGYLSPTGLLYSGIDTR